MRGDTFSGDALFHLNLTGLTIGSPQVCGSIRLVPLLRDSIRNLGDLRLGVRPYNETLTITKTTPRVAYAAYVPHAYVLRWTKDGEAVTSWGAQLTPTKQEGKRRDFDTVSLRIQERMVKREGNDKVRLLPLHLAMEGFLSVYFGGPEIAWAEYSRRLYRYGLSPRYEQTVSGEGIMGLDEALRVFEIADGQVGVLFFVADALASIFIVPHPDDYRDLHETLLKEFYGELIAQYALMYDSVVPAMTVPDANSIHTLTDLRHALAGMRKDWAHFGETLASGLLAGRTLRSHTVRDMHPFHLVRFMTDLDTAEENHIGEAIIRQETGETLYAKSYRLSAAQTRRAHFLSQLAKYNWNVDDAATGLKIDTSSLVLRIEKAGFDYLFTPEVRAAARKAHGLRGDAEI